ncbi:FeoB-associated Cys-rich membrane protein [Acetobacterium paludosum]|uniref:FeoB-associated Cys-rich membrane protein n=1 Tax=Acetobacterium paludosum TaxID=52693 RepID=A0A923HW04_9FIRM|nr:FeoB-associated Cys-rich membrane protein [Acetobacterium paludosum]MBC3888662.1 FeoB-associated Cys-rich membrane protein [Acetobacterium paludosum]
MVTWILAALILGAAGYIIFKKVKKMKSGDFSCEGCKGGSCPGCKTGTDSSEKDKC